MAAQPTSPTNGSRPRIAIVGASVAGVAAAEAIARTGFDGSVDIFDAQDELPYDRPPLSKQFALGAWNEDRLRFHDADRWNEIGATLWLGCEVVSVGEGGRRLSLFDGSTFTNDGLIIATGAAALSLPCLSGRSNVSSLRTLADGRQLSDALRHASSLAIVGSGFIGLEVAAVASSLGISVTIVEVAALPMAARLGETAAKRIRQLHEDHDVRFLCGRTVTAVEGEHQVTALVLDDGTRVAADYVLVGIGVRPALDWLEGSGIAVENGIVCNEHGRTSLANVYAAGDAASWINPLFKERMRLEHWTTAREQGQHAALALLAELEGSSGRSVPFDHIPYVWSDQYGLKIQTVGRFLPSDTFRVDLDDPTANRFAGSYWRSGRLRGAIAINLPKQIMSYRRELQSGGVHRPAAETNQAAQ